VIERLLVLTNVCGMKSLLCDRQMVRHGGNIVCWCGELSCGQKINVWWKVCVIKIWSLMEHSSLCKVAVGHEHATGYNACICANLMLNGMQLGDGSFVLIENCLLYT